LYRFTAVAPPDLGTTNFWLMLIAVASLGQLALLIVGGVVAYRSWRGMSQRLDDFQRRQLDPVIGRLNAVLDDARDALDRARRADDGVRRVLDRTGATVQRAAWAARSRLWPVLGMIRGVRAALARFSQPSHPRLEQRPSGSTD
jgi:hypothetical protein